MEKLNLMNAEELVFRDESLRRKLPEFEDLFGQWKLSILSPALRQLGKRAILDFLGRLDDSHLEIIRDHVGFSFETDAIDYRKVKNFKFSNLEIPDCIDGISQNDNLLVYLDDSGLSITSWR